jgi:AMP nucleosidase
MNMAQQASIRTPDIPKHESFTDAKAAVERLQELYSTAVKFLSENFSNALNNGQPEARVRAFYPEIRLTTTTYAKTDTRLSFGHVAEPGVYATTVTRPDLFAAYLEQQIGLLIESHGVPVVIGASSTEMPVHFAAANNPGLTVPQDGSMEFNLRDNFDVPDLSTTHDNIVNGEGFTYPDGARPLAPFTAQRVDYSLARLAHYTATAAEHFQNHVLFTNYQFYVEEFEAYARHMLADPDSGYTSFVSTGNVEITEADAPIAVPAKLPQMPTYHLKRKNGGGITLVNIGVGPSNAKTATDHIAVLRPHAWLMVGHCAGLRNSQRLGDFVLAHAYLREDHVLDDDLPVWVPIPALAEIQIALDMESATIAANGFRFRVPYGTLLCVSDKPLHGELKLPGMASEFYKTQVAAHLMIGIRAMERLRDMPLERIHSRKLRSFEETAFL